MTDDGRPIIIELQYLPPLEYFVLLQRGEVILDGHEHYVKQSYRNRCYIMGPHQVEKLTVPVRDGNKKIKSNEILIDYRQKWVLQHRRALQTAYGKSHFFEYYAPFFLEVYEKEPERLWDLNYELLTLCLKLLRINTTIRLSKSYLENTNPAFLDCRSRVNPKKSTSALNNYRPRAYNQIFGKDFVDNLSVVDLLFCEGPAASMILHESGGRCLNN